MGEVITLYQEEALTLNRLRKSILQTQSQNRDGKFDDLLVQQKKAQKEIFSSIYNDVVNRTAA